MAQFLSKYNCRPRTTLSYGPCFLSPEMRLVKIERELWRPVLLSSLKPMTSSNHSWIAPPRTSDASSQTKQRNQETGSKSKWDSIKIIITSKTEVLQTPSAIEVNLGQNILEFLTIFEFLIIFEYWKFLEFWILKIFEFLKIFEYLKNFEIFEILKHLEFLKKF